MEDHSTEEDLTPLDPPHNSEDFNKLVSKNVLISMFANGLYLVTRLFIPPLTLSFVDLEAYGIWASCFVLLAYLGMGAFGISNAYIRYVGVFFNKCDFEAINRLVSTGLAITVTGAIILMFALWFLIPEIVLLLRIAPENAHMAFLLFFTTACIFLLDLSVGAFAYVLIGMQKIVAEKSVWITAFCLEALLIVAFLFGGLGIYALMWAFLLRYVFSIISSMILCFRCLPSLSISFAFIDWRYLRYFVRFGGIVQLNGILSMIMGSIEKVLAALFLKMEAVALFDIGQKFPRTAISLPGAITQAIFPATTYLQHGNRWEEIGNMYIKSSRYINIMTGVLMGFMAAFAAPIMTAWLGPDPKYQFAIVLMVIFTLPFQLYITTGPASAVFKGTGRPWLETVYPIIQIVVIFSFTLTGFALYGKTSPVIGVSIACGMLASALIYMIYSNTRIHVRQGVYFSKVLLPGFAPYAIGALFLSITQRWLNGLYSDRWILALWLAIIGAAYTITSLAVAWLIFFEKTERDAAQRQLKAIAGDWLFDRFRKAT